MKVIIFGTGKMFQRVKNKLRKDIEIIAFIDNDSSKWNQKIEGITIFPPEEILNLEYDFVYLLSVYCNEMKKQLELMGVPKEKVFHTYHLEKICICDSIHCFGKLPEESNSKKILVFSHALTSTGAQNVLFIALQLLQKNGYQLIVLSSQDGVLRERITDLKIPVIIMEDSYFMEGIIDKFINWADKIIVNTLWLYYIVEEILPYKKKVIWWIHESGYFRNLDIEIFERISKADQVFIYVVSELVKRMIFQIYNKNFNIGVLPYGLPMYDNYQKSIAVHEKMIFAVIGSISYIKAQDIFLQAVEQLSKNDRENAEFWLVGGGQLNDEYQRYVQSYPCIKVIGEVDNKEIRDLYSKIDVVVCCSREEALSVVITEGCMNEKLVIVSNAAGIADYIINGKNGFVFQSENIKQLAELLKWTIDHREQAYLIGKMSKNIYWDNFTIEKFEQNLLLAIERQGDV